MAELHARSKKNGFVPPLDIIEERILGKARIINQDFRFCNLNATALI